MVYASSAFLHDENLTSILAHARLPKMRDRAALEAWRRRIESHLDPGSAFRRPWWHRCSVVGSSGAMAYYKDGAAIDEADATFRINAAPVRGFTDHVGSRTTFRVWAGRESPEEVHWRGDDNASIVLYCQPMAWVGKCWQQITPNQRQPFPYPRVNPLVWLDVKAALAQRANVTTRRSGASGVAFPSAGAIAVWMAMLLCRRVRIFGFGDWRDAWNCPLRRPLAEAHARYFGPDGTPRAACGRYFANGYRAEGSVRLGCGAKSSVATYLRDASRFHDLQLEKDWLAELFRQGRLLGPPCAGQAQAW